MDYVKIASNCSFENSANSPLKKITSIANFTHGSLVYGFYICNKKQIRFTKYGDPFLDLELYDNSGIIYAKMWTRVDYYKNKIIINEPFAVKGKVALYNNQLQLELLQIKKINTTIYKKYGFKKELFYKTEPSLNKIWIGVTKIINSLSTEYKVLVSNIYNKYSEIIKILPENINEYPEIRGSYISSKLIAAKIGIDIIKYFPSLNRDLLLSGILLKNIGMVKAVKLDFKSNYTEEAKSIGVQTLTIKIILNQIEKLKKLSKYDTFNLEKLILFDSIDASDILIECSEKYILNNIFNICTIDKKIVKD